jgi:hypothetical protein
LKNAKNRGIFHSDMHLHQTEETTPVEQDAALGVLRPHFDKIAFAIVKSFETYRTRYPHRPIHQRRTAANVMCDEIWAEIVNAFDDDLPRVRPIEQKRGLRLLGIGGVTGEIEILLWFKKVDRQHRPKSFPTIRAKRMLKGDNLEMFKKATTLVVGYNLNREQNRIVSVSIIKMVSNRADWFIDLELPEDAENLIELPDTAQASIGSRVVVRPGARQTRLG